MRDFMKGMGSVLVLAGSLFLFALACAEAPTAPVVTNDNPVTGLEYAATDQDTFPPR